MVRHRAGSIRHGDLRRGGGVYHLRMGKQLALAGVILFMFSALAVRHLHEVSLVGCGIGFLMGLAGLGLWTGDKRRRERRLEEARRLMPPEPSSSVDASGQGVMALGVEVTSRSRLALRRLLASVGFILGIQIAQATTFGVAGVVWVTFWFAGLLALFLRDRAAMPLPTSDPHYRALRIRIDSGELVLGDDSKAKRIPLSARRSGFVASSAEGAITTLWLGSRIVFAHMPSSEAAQALLHAADAGPHQRIVELALVPRALRKIGTWVAALALFPVFALPAVALAAPDPLLGLNFAHGMALLTAFGISLGAVLCWRYSRLPTMAIGADGIDVRGAAPNRFISYDEVQVVAAGAKSVRLGLKSHETIELEPQLMMIPNPLAARKSAAQMLCGQIQWNLDRHREGVGGAARHMHELERRGREVEDWLEGVSRLGKSAEGYRSGFLDVEQLERVVADPNESPDRRIGASMALMRTEDREAVSRARVAVGRIAQAPLRTAIESTLEGELELEAIEEATAVSSSSG